MKHRTTNLNIEKKKRKQLEIKVVDGTHIRNNLRVAICKDKIETIRKEAWIKVAESNTSPLKTSLLEVQADGKILDQQKEEYTRLMFCSRVQEVMETFVNSQGEMMYKEESKFCELIRNWTRAEDEPGLKAVERVLYSLKLKHWLLKDIQFNKFPPPSQNVKGIPIVTFEAIVCSIDAHLYLYSLAKAKTYNWRSVSSLVAETFMSDIDYMDNWARNGVLTAHGAKMHMKTVCSLHAFQHDPDRSFNMRIARAPVYNVKEVIPCVSNHAEVANSSCPCNFITTIVAKNHHFDVKDANETAFERRVGRLSGPDDPARGTQPVRVFYKVDESKVLHSKRLGVDVSGVVKDK